MNSTRTRSGFQHTQTEDTAKRYQIENRSRRILCTYRSLESLSDLIRVPVNRRREKSIAEREESMRVCDNFAEVTLLPSFCSFVCQSKQNTIK
ncbi:hypothetical protein CIPAW_11G080300 [Carya illinoinensis]|uniref:Uncharacterized protein n=1 Tax=Carya illinoinensis TaxID=32201 RepID=A0A8T1P134_CARIL|nr:hypothetical protein CIPAW_11G080300 [Carya illinoinensis]